MKAKVTPAVFLDRDGTIIEDRGHLRLPSEVVFFPDTVAALQKLQKDFRLFIVTHQSGIARGIVTADEVKRVNEYVVGELSKHGIVISDVYCCPHLREDGCICVKPNPYFLQQAADSYGLNLAESFVVGDHPHDVVLADNAGALGIYVLTGHGVKHRTELSAGQTVVPGIREAVEWIFSVRRVRRRSAENSGELDRAATVLRNGGIVAFPTETVYGLGAEVFDEKAVARIFEVKQRPRFDPLIVHVSSPEQLPLLVEELPEAAEALINRFWPGPLTLVLPKTACVPDLVTAGLTTVAVRMPRHPLALDLIARTGTPVAAPSANPFGYVSPTTAGHVLQHLGNRPDMVLDGGPCTVGLESTVLSLATPCPTILRAGGIAHEDIEQVIGNTVETASAPGRLTAPGQTPSHYSPRTMMVLDGCDCVLPPGVRAGRLRFGQQGSIDGFAATEELSLQGDVREAAINLFAALHRLDALGLDMIVADAVPETGLGAAVMDRLRRAAAKAPPACAVSEPYVNGRGW
jgi:L-threonylcarbamoyladenylate synthase